MNMYSIPIKDLIEYGGKTQISLRTEQTNNNQGFQSYKYLVQF